MKWLLSVLSLSFAIPAFANDGGVVGVKVEDLKIEKVDLSDYEHPVTSPLTLKDNESVQMSFKNGAVRELMKFLPGGRFVAKDWEKHNRTLTVAAKEGNLTINCADADLKFDESGEGDSTTYTPKEPSCTVTMTKFQPAIDNPWDEDMFGDWEDLSVPPMCQMP